MRKLLILIPIILVGCATTGLSKSKNSIFFAGVENDFRVQLTVKPIYAGRTSASLLLINDSNTPVPANMFSDLLVVGSKEKKVFNIDLTDLTYEYGSFTINPGQRKSIKFTILDPSIAEVLKSEMAGVAIFSLRSLKMEITLDKRNPDTGEIIA